MGHKSKRAFWEAKKLQEKKNKKEFRSKNSTKEWKRAGTMNRHHIVNKCRGGRRTPENMLNMDMNRHKAWHFLFLNMSFEEVIELLKRVIELKKSL